MNATLLLISCLALISFSFGTYDTTGKHFVASCPWRKANSVCTAHVYTRQRIAKVAISRVAENRIRQTETYFIGRDKPLEYSLDEEPPLHADNRAKPNRGYPVSVFKSAERFNVIVLTWRNKTPNPKADAMVLIPKSSCHHSYFTVTASASPFITIFSFDGAATNIKVQFPTDDYTQSFDGIDCLGTKCGPGKTVALRLLRYDVWYFTVDSNEANLRNVHISSDRPVHVVSGNRFNKDGSGDIATTSLKPSTAWGKTYIVPSMATAPKRFAISTLTTPLKVSFQEKSSKKLHIVESIESKIYEYGITNNTLTVTSNIPFGLYQMFSSRRSTSSSLGDVSILNLIPVEQWQRSGFYKNFEFAKMFQFKYYLIAQASHPQDEVMIPAGLKTSGSFQWHTSKITAEKKIFSLAEFTLNDAEEAKIYMKSNTGRMMVYVTMTPFSVNSMSMATYPGSYYQSKIYQEKCTMTMSKKEMCFQDGIDNDCDGFVDEEMYNGLDDDGDGLVDEDVLEPYADGQWSDWTFVCNQGCYGANLSVRARKCRIGSMDGEGCQGESVQCNEKPCPKSCDGDEFVQNRTTCFCGSKCSSCERSVFECDGCLPGFLKSEHCLKPKPAGFKEKGCLLGRQSRGGSQAQDEKRDPEWTVDPSKVQSATVTLFLSFSIIGALAAYRRCHENRESVPAIEQKESLIESRKSEPEPFKSETTDDWMASGMMGVSTVV